MPVYSVSSLRDQNILVKRQSTVSGWAYRFVSRWACYNSFCYCHWQHNSDWTVQRWFIIIERCSILGSCFPSNPKLRVLEDHTLQHKGLWKQGHAVRRLRKAELFYIGMGSRIYTCRKMHQKPNFCLSYKFNAWLVYSNEQASTCRPVWFYGDVTFF